MLCLHQIIFRQSDAAWRNLFKIIKDHVYRMWKVEGRCTQLTSSSLHTYIIIGWHKSIVSSDWSDTMVWFGQILLYLTFHILYIWSLVLGKVTNKIFKKLIQLRRHQAKTPWYLSVRCVWQHEDSQSSDHGVLLSSDPRPWTQHQQDHSAASWSEPEEEN